MEYIHYGSDKFDIKKFNKISNIPEFLKPAGGLWASRENSEYGWKQWCSENAYNTSNLNKYFKFSLKENARILVIEKHTQLEGLPINKENKIMNKLHITLDFEELAKQYDAIEVLISKDHKLYWDLYGWDCDSILVMNPDIIKNL